MAIFLTVLHIIFCVTLILVILLQAGRGHGLTGATFGSGNVQSLLGTRAGDFMTKATSVAAICFLLTCIGLDVLEAQKSRSLLQVPRTGAPLDINQIKQALEKVKAEAAATGEETAAQVDQAVVDAKEPAQAALAASEEAEAPSQ